MNNGTVEQLAQLRGAPAVSILCPLDASGPETRMIPCRARSFVTRGSAVRAPSPGRAASSMSSRIDDALAAIDLEHPTPGVAVFVSPDVSRIIALDSSVDPEVVVG